MYVIRARNVTEALYEGLDLLRAGGHRRASRNGPVWKMDAPVTTCYLEPRERVVTWGARDANPFFHLYESLWMLAGRREVGSLKWYVKRMQEFSDDGLILHGAYGWRWRYHFGSDQLEKIISILSSNPDDRRCVLGMWDPQDLGADRLDVPCNLLAKFSISRHGRLDMTVFCRSNDIVWGAYGANAVHFSMLQEYMAAGIGCEVGRYWQVSDDWHGYERTVEPLFLAIREPDPYAEAPARLWRPLVENFRLWNHDLRLFMAGVAQSPTAAMFEEYQEPFFHSVAAPMHAAYALHRAGKTESALKCTELVAASDWARAAREWLSRRDKREHAVHPA